MTEATGVLFDIDGTLCDTNYLHAVAWSRAINDVGEYASMSALHHHIGMGSDKFTEAVLGSHNEGASEAHDKHFEKMYDEVRAFPAAADLLRSISKHGVTVVLATSADPDQLKVLRKAINADDAIADATHADDAEASKPSPDIFNAALKKSDLQATNCMVVGDTVWDVTAAKEAGMPCVGVLTGGISRAELRDAGAVAVYEDVADLLAHLDESPIARLFRAE